MLVNYPLEWDKYIIPGSNRMFSNKTPEEIIEKAKVINEKMIRFAGRPFFTFETKAPT